MTRGQFRSFIEKTLLELIQFAELYADKELPKELSFTWASDKLNFIEGRENIINEISEKVYVSTDKIYPCVDLIVEEVTIDNKLKVSAGIAGFEPRPFQNGWSGRKGPFIYGVSAKVISPNVNTKDEQFILKLKARGLIHYNPNL